MFNVQRRVAQASRIQTPMHVSMHMAMHTSVHMFVHISVPHTGGHFASCQDDAVVVVGEQ